jgi:hypothetical protein
MLITTRPACVAAQESINSPFFTINGTKKVSSATRQVSGVNFPHPGPALKDSLFLERGEDNFPQNYCSDIISRR